MIVWTGLSNLCRFVVHFFGTPQKSEPKKTRTRERPPLVDPPLTVAGTCGTKSPRALLPSVQPDIGSAGQRCCPACLNSCFTLEFVGARIARPGSGFDADSCCGDKGNSGRGGPWSSRCFAFSLSPRRNPLRFRRFFETAKARSALCSNRVCLAKNATAFFACNTRLQSGFLGAGP